MDLCEFEASLVYKVNSRTARATQKNPVSKKTKPKQTKKKKACVVSLQSQGDFCAEGNSYLYLNLFLRCGMFPKVPLRSGKKPK